MTPQRGFATERSPMSLRFRTSDGYILTRQNDGFWSDGDLVFANATEGCWPADTTGVRLQGNFCNTQAVYQLHASCSETTEGFRHQMASKHVFESRVDAEAFIPEFLRRCCDPTQVPCYDPKKTVVSVVALELVGA